MLAIGTLGNSTADLKEDTRNHDSSEESKSSQELDFSLDDVIKLQTELTELLSRNPKSITDGPEKKGEGADLPLNIFLNCPSSLEVEHAECGESAGDLSVNGENNGDLSPISKIILRKARDILANKRNVIAQKSFLILWNKMFACRSGTVPAPSLRDQLSETRMEKVIKHG